MKLSPKQYAQALMEALNSTAPADTDKVLDNFVQLLAENNDLRLFDEISNEFHKKELDKKGIKQAEVTSAHPLNQENEKHIIEVLNKHVKGQVELKKKIDENLLGGVMIQVDDTLIDATVKNSLEQLKRKIEE